MAHRRVSSVLFAALLFAAAPAWAQLPGIKVTTDRSVDCSSFQSIARDLARDAKTDEEKAIACWYFVRRMLHHWPHPSGAGSREIDWINSSGYGLCGAQSMVFCQVCQAAGLKAGRRYMPSHVTAEVFYDGKWHFFDCQVGWFARTKDKSTVAGIADLVKDTTLITEAVENGTGSVPFMQCRDKYHKNGRAVDWVQKARGLGNGRDKPRGKLATAKLTLLPGMTYTRCWYRETDPKTGKPHRSLNRSRTPTRHGCDPAAERDDTVNFPLWEPYLVEGDGNDLRRTYGNGRLVYRPDLRSATFRAALAANGSAGAVVAKADADAPTVHPAKAGEPGVIILPVQTPYHFAGDGWIDAEFVRNTADDVNRISVSLDEGKTWKPAWTNEKLGTHRFEAINLHDVIFDRYRGHGKYLVKIELLAAGKPADAGLKALTLTHVFVNNIHTLPYLLPGKNRVRVAADDGAKLDGGKLVLTYCWWQQGKPREDHVLRKEITALPFECEVTIDTEKLPRMRYVRLEMPAAE